MCRWFYSGNTHFFKKLATWYFPSERYTPGFLKKRFGKYWLLGSNMFTNSVYCVMHIVLSRFKRWKKSWDKIGACWWPGGLPSARGFDKHCVFLIQDVSQQSQNLPWLARPTWKSKFEYGLTSINTLFLRYTVIEPMYGLQLAGKSFSHLLHWKRSWKSCMLIHHWNVPLQQPNACALRLCSAWVRTDYGLWGKWLAYSLSSKIVSSRRCPFIEEHFLGHDLKNFAKFAIAGPTLTQRREFEMQTWTVAVLLSRIFDITASPFT